MLDAGIQLGLGLDSAATGGPIDMFAEMRAALSVSLTRGRYVAPEEIWLMATEMGNRSLPLGEGPEWGIFVGSATPLLKVHVEGAQTVEDLIERGTRERVEWLGGLV